VSPIENPKPRTRKELFNLVLISITGSVGCITVAILLGAVFAGMWLDNHFGTKSTYTIMLLLVSIPVSVVVMVFATRAVIKKIQPDLDALNKKNPVKENRPSGS
jgi:ABC-type dipeptide/oligopeptide/nickel transport system permease component